MCIFQFWSNYLLFTLSGDLQLRVFISHSYEKARKIRVAVIHGMARMAAIMASTYKAYLGVGLGPLSVGIFDNRKQT